MTAVPPCPHYLVTLFLSKVIFFFWSFLFFFPLQTGLAPVVVHKWIWNFFSDPHSAYPNLFPLCLLDFSSIFISPLQKLFSLFAISHPFGCLRFLFCWALIFFPSNNLIMLPSFSVCFSVYFTLCSKHPVIGTQFLYKETKLVPASSWKPLMTWQLSASYKQSPLQPSCIYSIPNIFPLVIFLNEKWRMLTLDQVLYLISKYNS